MNPCKNLLVELKSKYPENYEQLALLIHLHPEWCKSHKGGCDDNCPRKLTSQLNKENLHMSTELQELEFRANNAESELRRLKEQQATDDQNRQVKAFQDSCEALVKTGVMTPADRDQLFSSITPDGVPWNAFLNFIENRTFLDTREYGEQGDGFEAKYYATASEELADRAKNYSVKNKVDYEVAQKAILEQDTDLAERYKME